MTDALFDFDILRGWKETRDPELAAPHKVDPLAYLVQVVDDEELLRVPIHGPDVYVGRYHPQNGPVDVIFDALHDEQIYKLGAPHIRLSCTPTGKWHMRMMSATAFTYVNRKLLTDTKSKYQIKNNDLIKMGVVTFKFEKTELTFQDWKDQQKEILLAVESPSLFLVRNGAVCGPKVLLKTDEPTVLGRSFPKPGELPGEAWLNAQQPDWDLAGAHDPEKKYVGFRHCEIWQEDDDWFVKPITSRQRTYVNRTEISAKTPLMPGDELALGSLLFHFHHPDNIRASTDRKTVDLPVVLDWKEGYHRAELATEHE